MMSYVIQVFTALLGSLGFAIIFKMKRRHLPAACIGGGATWVVYLLCVHFGLDVFFANLIATLFASAYSEVVRNLCKTPRTVFVIPAVVPLIPGSSLYYAMSAVVAEDESLAADYAVQTGLVAGAIAFGILLFTVFFHVVHKIIRLTKAE
ncbi:MAG: threonine/serine exporter family protein [Treponema sp.]|nr:threonine/serine exporter family protein [Treponema sp.]